jgi:hypothetical protein
MQAGYASSPLAPASFSDGSGKLPKIGDSPTKEGF